MVKTGKKLSELIKYLYSKVGHITTTGIDFHFSEEKQRLLYSA